MCGPDIPDPKPAAKALPRAAETADRITTKGNTPAESEAQGSKRTGLDALRVDLNVPDSQGTPSGGFGSLLARLL